jgi:hypothetical protein
MSQDDPKVQFAVVRIANRPTSQGILEQTAGYGLVTYSVEGVQHWSLISSNSKHPGLELDAINEQPP